MTFLENAYVRGYSLTLAFHYPVLKNRQSDTACGYYFCVVLCWLRFLNVYEKIIVIS